MKSKLIITENGGSIVRRKERKWQKLTDSAVIMKRSDKQLTPKDIAEGFNAYNTELMKLCQDASNLTDKSKVDSILSRLKIHSDMLDRDIKKLKEFGDKLKENLKIVKETSKSIESINREKRIKINLEKLRKQR